MEISKINDIISRFVFKETNKKSIKTLPIYKKIQSFENEPLKDILRDQKEIIQELAERFNKFMQTVDYNLQFIPDQKEGTVIIKVLDKEGNLIRQIPPEEFLVLSSHLGEHIGVFIKSTL